MKLLINTLLERADKRSVVAMGRKFAKNFDKVDAWDVSKQESRKRAGQDVHVVTFKKVSHDEVKSRRGLRPGDRVNLPPFDDEAGQVLWGLGFKEDNRHRLDKGLWYSSKRGMRAEVRGNSVTFLLDGPE